MANSSDLAVPPGADPQKLTRFLNEAHDAFVSTGLAGPAVRQVVVDSWQRSVNSGINPEDARAPIRLREEALAEIRAAHPLATVMPVIRRLLVDSAAEAGLLVAVSDAAGQLLWVEGSSSLRARAEAMHFVEGADWSEAAAGTNAPGTALALNRPVQIFGPEHLSRQVTPWSCSAAPIHDPDTGAILGVLDLTGGQEVAAPQSLSLVRATVAAAESELKLHRLNGTSHTRSLTSSGWSAPRMDVLGSHGATLSYATTTTRLSLRHSEILLLLASSEHGMTAGELAVALSDDEQASVTIRAELSRLRGLLGPIELASRPYRLTNAIHTDVARVRDALKAGQVRRAVSAYRGPILPASTAPAVVEMRDDLHMYLRSSLLSQQSADALLSFADTAHGREDLEIWDAALTVLPLTSPRYTQVAAHCAELDAEFC
ncbi:MAG: transcriptional regulator [Aeromicrobium sp.]